MINVDDLPDDNVLLGLGLKNTYLYLVESLPVEKIRELLAKAEQQFTGVGFSVTQNKTFLAKVGEVVYQVSATL